MKVKYDDYLDGDMPKNGYSDQQSQQAKIDELQCKYDDLNNRTTGIALDQMTTAKLNYELQCRIDEALSALDRLQYSSGERIRNDVGNILKGNKE